MKKKGREKTEYGLFLTARAALNTKLCNILVIPAFACSDLPLFEFSVGQTPSQTPSVVAEVLYQAKSWNRERRIVIKMEKPADELLFNFTFIVTNVELDPEDIIRMYCNRGRMENFKEAKNGFACQIMSSTSFKANEVKLQISKLAYNFNNWFHRLCFLENMQPSRMETVRTQVVKIAAKLVRSGRYWTWKLCSSCVYKRALQQIFENIGRIPQLE